MYICMTSFSELSPIHVPINMVFWFWFLFCGFCLGFRIFPFGFSRNLQWYPKRTPKKSLNTWSLNTQCDGILCILGLSCYKISVISSLGRAICLISTSWSLCGFDTQLIHRLIRLLPAIFWLPTLGGKPIDAFILYLNRILSKLF